MLCNWGEIPKLFNKIRVEIPDHFNFCLNHFGVRFKLKVLVVLFSAWTSGHWSVWNESEVIRKARISDQKQLRAHQILENSDLRDPIGRLFENFNLCTSRRFLWQNLCQRSTIVRAVWNSDKQKIKDSSFNPLSFIFEVQFRPAIEITSA